MNFLADESIDKQIVDHLRQEGHQVWYVAEMEPGISDDAVLDLSNQKKTLLLTGDKDFGELVFRQGRATSGIVLIRLAGLSQTRKAEIVSSAISKHAKQIPEAFTVITSKSIRIRHLNI